MNNKWQIQNLRKKEKREKDKGARINSLNKETPTHTCTRVNIFQKIEKQEKEL